MSSKQQAHGRNVVVIGTQWGDEGKGKVVDWLTDHAQACAWSVNQSTTFPLPSSPHWVPMTTTLRPCACCFEDIFNPKR